MWTVIKMRNQELIKILFIPILVAIVLIFFFIESYKEKEDCRLTLTNLNSFYELSNSPVKKGANIISDGSYFAFKTAGGNSLMYYLLVEKKDRFELHKFFQFGGWKSQNIEVREGRLIFDKLRTLSTEPNSESKLFHTACAVTEYRDEKSKTLKYINESHPVSVKIMNEIFSKRESIYNQEEHLFRMKDSQINYLNKDVFAELGER